MLLIQIATVLVFPYFIFFSGKLKETSLMRNIYELGGISRAPMIAIIAVFLSIQSITLLLYSFNWMKELYQLRIQMRRKEVIEDRDDVMPQNQRHNLAINMALYVFVSKVLSIPSKTCCVRSIMQVLTTGPFNMTLFSLSVVLLIVDTINNTIFHNYLQTVFPIIIKNPWASAERTYQNVLELTVCLFSILCSIHQSQNYSMWIYLSFTPLAVILALHLKTPYADFTMILQNASQASIITSMIIFTIMLRRLQFPREQFSVIIFINLICVYLFLNLYTKFRKRRLLDTKEILTNSSQAQLWLWAFEHEFQYHKETNKQDLINIFVNFEIILMNHQQKCNDCKCKCKKQKIIKLMMKSRNKVTYEMCNKLKIALIEIQLHQILTRSEQQLEKTPQNDVLGLIMVYHWFNINKNHLSCVYNLTKYHDCQSCSIYECFQYNILQRIIQKEIKYLQKIDEGQRSFQKMIHFESNFKHFQRVIDTTINQVQEYWQVIQKNQFDIVKSEQMSSNLLRNYKRFQSIYNFLSKECGDIISIESLAWRLHQDILNFDGEAYQNLEKIKQIITKQRFNNKSDLSSTSQFNFKCCFIVVGAFKHNFHKILAVSKYLVRLSGFSEELLIQSTLQILLPQNQANAHEKYIKKYLKRKKGDLNSSRIVNQWMRTYNSVLTPVNINVLPKYDQTEGLRLIGIIEPIKKFEIFETVLNVQSVFGMFTNFDYKIVHITENCIEKLKMHEDIQSLELFVHQIFTKLPETLENEASYITDIDLTLAFSNQVRDMSNFKRMLIVPKHLVKFVYREKVFDNDQITREFLFVIIGNSNETFSINDQNLVLSPNRQSLAVDDGIHQQEEMAKPIFSSESKSMDMTSISSQGSSSSNTSQDTQLNAIKSTLQFKQLPQSLKSYKFWLFIGFSAIIVMSLIMLGYNLYTKQKFQDDLVALQFEKKIKNNFYSSSLCLLMLYTGSNMPSSFNVTKQVQITKIKKQGYTPFYQSRLNDTVTRVHSFLGLFSKNSKDWDQQFVNQMNTDEVSLTFITKDGNDMSSSQNFYKSIALYLDYTDNLINTPIADYKMQYDVFDMNTLSEYQKQIKKLNNKQQTILQYVTFVLFNAGNAYLDKMEDIDSNFINKLYQNSDDFIKIILIMAVAFACIVLIIFSLYIPYYFGIEQLNEKIVRFISKQDKEVIQGILKQGREFKEFIEKNRYMLMSHKKMKHALPHHIHDIHGLQPIQEEEEEFKESDHYNTEEKQFNSNEPMKNMKNFNDIQQKLNKPTVKSNKSKGMKKKAKKLTNEILEENSDEEKEAQDEHDEDEDQEHSEKHEHHHQDINKNISKKISNKDHAEQLNFQKIAIQSQKRKLVAIIIFFLIGSLFAMFFIVIYFMCQQLFSQFAKAFYLFDVFYLRNTCGSETHFLLQRSILLNQSLSEDSQNGEKFSMFFEKCRNNEDKYRDIKKDSTGIFANILDELEIIDSPKLCQFLINQGQAGSECYTDANGIMQLGLEQLMQHFFTAINQQKIAYSSSQFQQTPRNLEKLFFDQDVIVNIGIYYAYLQWLVRWMQDFVKSTFDQKMDESFVQIVAIYTVFEIVVIFLAILCIYKLINYLKQKLLQIRFLLKLLPSTEIIKHKRFLDKLNTRLL